MARALTSLNGKIPPSSLVSVGTNANDGSTATLRTDAARSYQRMRTSGLPAGITTSYRSYDAQVAMYAAYKAGRLTATAAIPGRSWHGEGLALDLPGGAITWCVAHAGPHGWRRPLMPSEPWHWEYDPDLDQHRTPASASTPSTSAAPAEEEDDMDASQAAALARVDQRAANAEPVIAGLHERLGTIDATSDRVVAAVNALGRIEAVLAARTGTTTGLDTAAVAAQIADAIDDDVARAVADLLAKRLVS